MLEGVDLPDRLADLPSDGRSHNFHRLHDAIGVDEESAADIDPGFLFVDTVDLAEMPGGIRKHRPRNAVFGHFGEFFLDPDFVGEGAVSGGGENLHTELGQLVNFAGDRRQFGWSDKGEIARIETEQDPFAGEIG